MQTRIVVVGSVNMDLVVQAERMPIAGETVLGQDFHTIPGGKGANQAVAAARLGAHVTMIGCVGDDAFGTQMIDQLVGEGIDTLHIRVVEDKPTGIAVIQVEQGGGNRIIVVPEANAELTADDIRLADNAISQADVMLVQLEIPLEAVEEAVTAGRRHGLKVILNPAPARVLPDSLLAKVDYLTPNESELAVLLAAGAFANEDLALCTQQLAASTNAGTVLVTMGDKGTYSNNAKGEKIAYPACKVDVVDTTAAGDSYNAGIAVALSEGRSLEEAILFASKVGALTVTRFGAQPSLPHRSEVDAFPLRSTAE